MPILASFIKAGAAVMQILQVPYPFSNSKYPFLLFVLHPTEKKQLFFVKLSHRMLVKITPEMHFHLKSISVFLKEGHTI